MCLWRTAWQALVAELVDAADSKSVIRKDVGVQVPPGAPTTCFSKFLTVQKSLYIIGKNGVSVQWY
jgi:hypothetical protein